MAAGKGKRISGIYVPITLDTSSIQSDLESLRNELGRAGETMMKSFSGALESNKLVKGFIDATRAVGQLRDSVRAFDNLKPMGGFQQSLDAINPELRALALTLGITKTAQKELLTQMAQNQAINQQVSALKTLERTLGTSREETVKLAQSYGHAISQMALDRYLGTQKDAVKNLTDEYYKLAKAAGQAATAKGLQDYLNVNKIKEAVSAFRQLNPGLELTKKYYEQIAQAAGVATREVAAFMRAQQGSGRGVMGIFTPSSLSAGLQSALSAAGVVTGMYGVVELGKASVDAALKMDNITKAFESIYNSSEKANTQIQFTRDLSERLGLSFVDAAQGAKQMFASFQGTILEKDANKIYTAFANMGAAMKLTGDEMKSVYLAISQMASKGKVSAEELRQQLAERMPGAVTLFAKSIGVSTRELDKMLQDGAVGLEHLAKFADAVQEKYREGALAASTGLQAELNRVSNAWFDLKRAFVDTDALADTIRSFGSALRYLADNADFIAKLVSELAKFALITAGIYGAGKALQALVASFVALRGAIAASGLAGLAATLGPVGLGLGALSVALGTVVYGASKLMSSATDTQKRLESLGKQTFDLTASIQNLSGSIEDMTDAAKKAELTELEKKFESAKEKFKEVFGPQTTSYGLAEGFEEAAMAGIETVTVKSQSKLNELFAALSSQMKSLGKSELATTFQDSAMELAVKFKNGLENGLGKDELNKIFLELGKTFKAFQDGLKDVADNEGAIVAFEKLKNTLFNLGEEARVLNANLSDLKGSDDELQNLAEKATASFDAIVKLTKHTSAARENKLEAELKSLSAQFISTANYSFQAQAALEELDYTVAGTHEQFNLLRGPIEQMQDALPLVASYALQNGKDFQTMAASLNEAGVQAGFTSDQLRELHRVLQQAFNVEVGKVITNELQKLDLQIAQIGAKAKDTKAFSILSKVVTDAQDQLKLFNAIAAGDIKTLGDLADKYGAKIEDFNQTIEKSALFGSKSAAARGGGRSRVTSRVKETSDQLSAMGKEIQSLEKKIGTLQAKIDADPSAKYLAEVGGEIQKINNLIAQTNKGTEEEKQKLIALRDEYQQLANLRAEQMRMEEERQKKIEAASKMGGNSLMDVNYRVPSRVMVEALKAQYQENLEDYQKLCDAKIITEQEFIDEVSRMQTELNIKTEEANGSMLASFAAAFQKQMEKLADWRKQVADIFVDSVETMSDALADFAITGMKNAEDLQEAFKNVIDSMIQDLARLFMKMVVMSAMNKLFGSFFGGGDMGNLLSASNSMTSSFFGVAAAKGGVFAGSDISKYSGSIVTSPTVFSGQPLHAYAKGGNIMGEKGAEVVLPLRQGSDGRWGVEADGVSSGVEMKQSINVNIYNNSDSQVTTSQSSDSNGNLDIQIMVEKMVGESMTRTGSSPFRALRGLWQGQPALAQR